MVAKMKLCKFELIFLEIIHIVLIRNSETAYYLLLLFIWLNLV